MFVPCKNIPTYNYDTNKWSTTSFNNQKEFGEYLRDNCLKEPGEYFLDKSTQDLNGFDYGFNLPAKKFKEFGRYTEFGLGTPEYYDYWDQEELKCRLGVLWKHGDKVWYLTRDYYFLLNYCPILNKEANSTESFMSVRDVQLHMMLYEKIAECFHLHSCVLKRRQMAYSNCHAAKSVNFLWFENKKTIKWFASKESYLNQVEGSWKMLDAFKNHLNANTDWVRIFTPAEYPMIQQKEKFLIKKGQWGTKGNESTLAAKPITHDATSGVGGAAFWIWHEEGGVAPKANLTLQYLNPALESGLEKIGSFHIGGSVGDLDDCKPLKEFLLKPDTYEMFKIPTKLFDETGISKECGLFIPAQYGMPQAVDEYGNSLVEKALKLLEESEEQWKKLPSEEYVLKKSQNPKTIKEAFAWRKSNYFNAQRIERRQKAIEILKEEGDWEEKQGLLEINREGNIVLKHLSSFPEHDRPTPIEYPVKPEQLDKRGCVIIFEEPEDDVTPGTYFAGVDSVEVGPTTTSDSIMTVHIYKRGCKIISTNNLGEQTTSYERGKIVAAYAGRFRNPKDHNEQGLLLLRKYKALAACERNKPNFINYCRDKGYAYLIARKSELPFDKDLDATGTRNDEYGVYSGNDGKLLQRLKTAVYEYIDAEIDAIHKKNSDGTIGEVIKTIRGYDLVNDYWLLEELKLYNEDGNFDRFISAGLAIILGVSRELDHEKTIYTQEKENKNKPTPIKKPVSLLLNNNRRYSNLLKR